MMMMIDVVVDNVDDNDGCADIILFLISYESSAFSASLANKS